MNNLLSYCGLVDARIRASDKDLTVYLLVKNCCHLVGIKNQLSCAYKHKKGPLYLYVPKRVPANS